MLELICLDKLAKISINEKNDVTIKSWMEKAQKPAAEPKTGQPSFDTAKNTAIAPVAAKTKNPPVEEISKFIPKDNWGMKPSSPQKLTEVSFSTKTTQSMKNQMTQSKGSSGLSPMRNQWESEFKSAIKSSTVMKTPARAAAIDNSPAISTFEFDKPRNPKPNQSAQVFKKSTKDFAQNPAKTNFSS